MQIYTEYYQSTDKTILVSDNLQVMIEETGYSFSRQKLKISYEVFWKDVSIVKGVLFVPVSYNENLTLDVLNSVLSFEGQDEHESEIWQEYNELHKDALIDGMYNEMEYVQAMLEFALQNNRYYIPEEDI